MRVMKAMASLRNCADSHQPSLLDNALSTKYQVLSHMPLYHRGLPERHSTFQTIGINWFSSLARRLFSFKLTHLTGISRPYQLDQSISVLRVVVWLFSFIFKF